MFHVKGNLSLKIIKSMFATFNTGLIFVGLVGCNAEEKLPSNPTEIQPPTLQPEAPNRQNDDDDDKEQENDNQNDDKD